MGKMIDEVVQAANRRINGQYGLRLRCPTCPEPLEGISVGSPLSNHSEQTTVGLASLHFLTEAVPAGVRPDPNSLLGLLVVKCQGCGMIRLFDATPELKDAVDQQNSNGSEE